MFAQVIPRIALSTYYCHPPPATSLTNQEKITTWLLMPALAIGRLEIIFYKKALSACVCHHSENRKF